MSFGVTDEGYVVKTQAEINQEAEADLEMITDPATGETLQADLSDPTDIVSQISAIALEGVADGVLVDQAAYNQFDPGKATEDALSSLVMINGIRRKQPTASTVLLDFTGTPDAVIPSGIQVSALNSEIIWLVESSFTFDGAGTGTLAPVTATSQTLGAVFANSGTLTTLVTGNNDITTVNNPADALPGNEEESDNALRRRRDLSTYAPSIGLVGSLDAAIKDITDVVFSRVYNNITTSIDANGLDPKSVGCVVLGGDDDEIAQTIIQRVSIGPSFSGDTTVSIEDNLGNVTDVKFYRPEQIPIRIEIDTDNLNDGTFPDNGVALIKEAIVAYSIGGATALGITEGFDIDGFPPGQDILLSRLYTPINSVPGHNVTRLEISIVPAAVGAVDVTIDFNEVGFFEIAEILVVVS